jgi:hypothetical protein
VTGFLNLTPIGSLVPAGTQPNKRRFLIYTTSTNPLFKRLSTEQSHAKLLREARLLRYNEHHSEVPIGWRVADVSNGHLAVSHDL